MADLRLSGSMPKHGQSLMRLMLFTLMISAMAGQMFNFVLPEISGQYELSMADTSWLASAYTLIYAIGTMVYGKLADQYKLYHLLLVGFTLLAVGSLIGLWSSSFEAALLARCIQSAGGAVIPAASMIIPIRYFSPDRRGRALGMAATGLALGSALAPVAASLLSGSGHWHWLFGIPILLLLTLPYYRRHLQEHQEEADAMDWLGGGLLASAVALLMSGITDSSGWLLLLSLAPLLLFVLRVLTATSPFIEPMLFGNRPFMLTLLISVGTQAIGVSLVFLVPLLLSEVQAVSVVWLGLIMVPAAVTAALLGRSGGRLADAKGNLYLFVVAIIALLICFFLLSIFTEAGAGWIAFFLIFGQTGLWFMMIVMSNTATVTLPSSMSGVGMGLFMMMNFLGQGVAIGIYGLMVDRGARQSWLPWTSYAESAVYSNIFFLLGVFLVLLALLYGLAFGQRFKR